MKLLIFPNTVWTVSAFTIASWIHLGCEGIIWKEVDIPWGFRIFNTGIQIIMGEMCIVCIQYPQKSEIDCQCSNNDDTNECLPLQEFLPPRLVHVWKNPQDTPVLKWSGYGQSGSVLNSVSATDTTLIVHRYTQDSQSVTYSLSYQCYSPT